MTRTAFPAPGSQLAILAREILQWNLQINLVTRVDTERQLETLLQHCCQAWNLAQNALGTRPWFKTGTYIDLGSGSGLPGLVWAMARDAQEHPGMDYLVEPRSKRAWFLRRTARRLGLGRVVVVESRWGEGILPGAGLSREGVFLSLKALRLDDLKVLQGLWNALGSSHMPGEVCILRFLGPGTATADMGAGSMAGPCLAGAIRTGSPTECEKVALVEHRILGETNPGLEMALYAR